MKRLILYPLLILFMAACQPQNTVRQQPPPAYNPALAVIQGSNLIATGQLNSLGGTRQTSGHVQIAAVDGQNMQMQESLVTRAANEVMSAVGTNRIDFPAIQLTPGVRVLDLVVTLSDYRINHRMSLTVESGRRYIIRGQNDELRGQIWIEDDRGYRTQPIGIMAR